MLTSWQHRVARLSALLALVGACFACLTASAQQSRVFRLESQSSAFSYGVNLPWEGEEVIFKQEPDYEGTKVVRGRFPRDPETGLFTGFAWDVAAGTLCLDLNRNLDLTDDGPSARHRFRSSRPTWFGGEIVLRVPKDGLELDYAISLDLHFSGRYRYQSMQIKSGWAGPVVLSGVTWEMGIVDNANGVVDREDRLFLRPPPEEPPHAIVGIEPFDEWGDPLSGLEDVPRYLWLDGRAYEIQYEFVQGEKNVDLAVTVTEYEPPLAQLDVAAPAIRRILLQDPGQEGGLATVVINHPTKRVQIPAGHYSHQQLLLDYGGEDGFLRTTATPDILAEPDKTVTYPYGPPLRNTVTSAFSGRGIYLRHQMLDRTGAHCSTIGRAKPEPPRFVIECDGEQVFSGAFRYG